MQANRKSDVAQELLSLQQAAKQDSPLIISDKCDERLVYLLVADDLLATDLRLNLEQACYRVQCFSELKNLDIFRQKKTPAFIITDECFSYADAVGVDAVSLLRNKIENLPYVIFISEYDDAEHRLKATHAGVIRYFCKPLQTNKLIHSVNKLKQQLKTSPYRILLIDNNETALKKHSSMLRESNMVVETLSGAMDCLELLANFKPDIVIIDSKMPECTGSEFAQMIRLDDRWELMPIMFLCSEHDINNHLHADDFILKPVQENKFLTAVDAVVKRARKNIQLNGDLKNSLRENKYQLITLDQHAVVATTDVSGQITGVNEKFCEVSGYSREELLGQNHRILKSNYHPDSFFAEMWRTISGGEVWRGTICNSRKNGDECWVDTTIVPFLDDNGTPYKYVSARTDITNTRKNAERLKRSQQFANIGTWDWDIRKDDMYWSDRVKFLYGYTPEIKKVTFEHFINIVHPEDQAAVKNAVRACLEDGVKYEIEHRVIWPDGSIHWLHETGDVIRDKDGKAEHMLGVVENITKRKVIEQTLIDAHDAAENANRAKSQFLSSMSHELRTPMNAIMGFSQLLIMETAHPLNENHQDSVNEIMTAGTHLMCLIDEVLDLSKIEAGRVELSIEKVVLGEVLSESLQIIMPLAQEREIDIILQQDDLDVSVESLTQQNVLVSADYSRLKQVLINLLSNAVKYNVNNGKITINCKKTDNNQLCIDITDTGAGLSALQQKQLFTAFNRLGAEQSEIEGTGIGLVIAKNIIELMDGSIHVESQAGVGSTFSIALPIAKEQSEDTKVDSKSVTDKPLSELLSVKQKDKQSVLYIEDNPANMRLVTNLLGRFSKLQVWSANKPTTGLELAIEHSPNLILLDINLPEMDGFEVLKLLRENEVTCNIPVIAISANAMPKDIQKGLDAGFDNYIVKPIDVTALMLIVEKELSATSTK